jgi:hypothetical protein
MADLNEFNLKNEVADGSALDFEGQEALDRYWNSFEL